ncbi:threonine/serine exporter family protein [Aeribacillus composti]|uniref:Threonine/serine exporter-like N-terminal domain-containing protein n=2 Tax=Aeribacillus TaxID=1055323 RepID=A0A165YY61_9BACI|nr:hypothetical protein AZI98_03090 [Aeribacillus pallidus]
MKFIGEISVQLNSNKIIEACLLAGKIMLENGAETYRVEDTMQRMATSLGVKQSHCFAMPTGIIFSIDEMEQTKLVRVLERTIDLNKVAMVNNISRRMAQGEISVDEALLELKQIDESKPEYPVWLQLTSVSILSGWFLIMFQGKWADFVPAMISGGLGFAFLVYVHRFAKIKFFSEFLASFVIGFTAIWQVKLGIGTDLDKIIIGSVMPLVPGLHITNAVRDLMAGHLVAGLSKGAEAFLTAFAIGSGIAIVLSIY